MPSSREVRYFAFPYGLPENMSTEAFRIARGAGYRGVCSAYGGYNFPGDDPFHIRRFHADPGWPASTTGSPSIRESSRSHVTSTPATISP